MFNFKTSEDEESTEDNVIELQLKVKCTRNPHASKEATDPDDLYINHKGCMFLNFCISLQNLCRQIVCTFLWVDFQFIEKVWASIKKNALFTTVLHVLFTT